MKKSILFIDDQEKKDGKIYKKLEALLNAVFEKDSFTFNIIGLGHYNDVLKVQYSQEKVADLIFLDAVLNDFNINNPTKKIKTLDIIKSSKEHNCNIIMLSQYKKTDDKYTDGLTISSEDNWFDEFHKAGVLTYINKGDLEKLELIETDVSFVKIKRLLNSVFSEESHSNYKVTLDYNGGEFKIEIKDIYSNEILSEIPMREVEIEDLINSSISIDSPKIAKKVIFRMLFELAYNNISYPLVANPKLIYKDYENITDNKNYLTDELSKLNTQIKKSLNIKTTLFSAGHGQREPFYYLKTAYIEISEDLRKLFNDDFIQQKTVHRKSDNNNFLQEQIKFLHEQVDKLTNSIQVIVNENDNLKKQNIAMINQFTTLKSQYNNDITPLKNRLEKLIKLLEGTIDIKNLG